MFGKLRRFSPALLVITVAACVTYPVTPVNELQPGHVVELTLSDSEIPAIAPQLGPGVFRVNGKLTEIDSLALALQVSHTNSTRNVNYHFAQTVHWNGDSVSIPRAGIVTARQRQFSGWLTALGVAVLGGSIAAMASLAHHSTTAQLPTLPTPKFP